MKTRTQCLLPRRHLRPSSRTKRCECEDRQDSLFNSKRYSKPCSWHPLFDEPARSSRRRTSLGNFGPGGCEYWAVLIRRYLRVGDFDMERDLERGSTRRKRKTPELENHQQEQISRQCTRGKKEKTRNICPCCAPRHISAQSAHLLFWS